MSNFLSTLGAKNIGAPKKRFFLLLYQIVIFFVSFLISLSKYIDLPNIAKVVALKGIHFNFLFSFAFHIFITIVGREITTYVERNTKGIHEVFKKAILKWSKEKKYDNFFYRKVGRLKTLCGAIVKSPILLSWYWKNIQFIRAPKIISQFWCTNIILFDCN